MSQYPMYPQASPPQDYYNRMMSNFSPYGQQHPYYPSPTQNFQAPPQPQAPQQQNSNFVCKQVANIEEAKGTILENPLSIYVLPDFQNGKIYVKHLTNSGMSELNIFNLQTAPTEAAVDTKPSIDVLANFQNEIFSRLDRIEQKINTGVKEHEHNGNNEKFTGSSKSTNNASTNGTK